MKSTAHLRTVLIISYDLLVVPLAWLASFFLRFNLEWPVGYENVIWLGLPPLLVLQLALLGYFGLHRSMWRFVGLPEMVRVVRAVGITFLLLLLVTLALRNTVSIPRSVVVLYPLLLLFFMGGARAVWRAWREYRMYQHRQLPPGEKAVPVIVVGAGSAGALLLRDLLHQDEWRVVGLVDDDSGKWGLRLSGVRVLGPLAALPRLMDTHKVAHIVVATPAAQRTVLQRVNTMLEGRKATLLTIPGIAEVMSGRVAINTLRPVAIEDLLGRDPVSIDDEAIGAMVKGVCVLVTGAGGSIGSELCRQVASFQPAQLVLVDSSEFALYQISQWFADHNPQVSVVSLVGDVKDARRMQQVFSAWQPQLVLHAAAYKHVPLMEVGNAWEAVRNNVLGTLVVARSALQYGAQRFVLVSTDKAVNPTNVMGATKRLAEILCEGLNGQETQFIIVRFGNVLGSTGSVIPRFRQQILDGGPLTVTHPDITRYFMLIDEAARLVLQAGTMGAGGEIFVLDMGEPVRIVDLARNMLRLSGSSETEIDICFTGLRPGEKLFEELLADAEQTLPTPHAKLRIAHSRPVSVAVFDQVSIWVAAEEGLDDGAVRQALQKWVPEYAPAAGQLAGAGSNEAVANGPQKEFA